MRKALRRREHLTAGEKGHLRPFAFGDVLHVSEHTDGGVRAGRLRFGADVDEDLRAVGTNQLEVAFRRGAGRERFESLADGRKGGWCDELQDPLDRQAWLGGGVDSDDPERLVRRLHDDVIRE
ncbi:MAG TPA: hypothetical protein VNL91_05750 [Thermoanaerobaculia bacterium]|nr:hypothetical protein [Thermoanaerobaculia bacterium]